MLDPVTAIATATAAFNGVRKLVAAGRDLEDCMGQMSQWYTAVSDLTEAQRSAKNPPLFKKLTSSKSVNAEAMSIWSASRKAQAQEKALREIITYAYGREAWMELIQLRRRIKLEREKAIYAQKRKRESTFWAVVTITVLSVVCYGFFAGVSFILNDVRDKTETKDK